MKKTAMLLSVVFLCAVGIFAQAKPDYSGEWTLDVSKSKVERIESMTIKATQSATDIKVETETKRTPNPNGGGQGAGGGRGPGGPMISTYTLDGKEATIEVDGPGGTKMPVKLKASIDGDGKLNLSSVRTFTGPQGEITATTTETWALSDGGKTLTIKRESVSPRGTQNSEFVLTKK